MDIDLDSCWSNLRGEISGRPGYLRLNEGLRPLVGSPRYHGELIISVKLRQPDENGLPSEEELAVLDQFEDVLRPLLQEGMESLLAIVMTTDGFRDFIFYSGNLDSAVRRMQTALQPAFGHLQVDVSGRPDHDWTQFRRFAG
jgi:hypothetical protein